MSVDPDATSVASEAAAAVGAPAPRRTARRPVLRFLVRRVTTGVLTLIVATMLIFAATDLLPGSPASNVLGKFATKSQVAALNRKLGFDKPLAERYLDWLGGALRGDLGQSAIGVAQAEGSAPIW